MCFKDGAPISPIQSCEASWLRSVKQLSNPQIHSLNPRTVPRPGSLFFSGEQIAALQLMCPTWWGITWDRRFLPSLTPSPFSSAGGRGCHLHSPQIKLLTCPLADPCTQTFFLYNNSLIPCVADAAVGQGIPHQ
eukprot:GGOE01029503.1.p1 GENE.GGOE01029503.1~~GGOE01029503.1.p1  ORF type:complete len:134 (-),score=0.10 GGOE01029503.1:463-864(-)